jgi:hypothetical protein
MWVNVGLALANIALDYFLIFGIGPFPELGMQGAALATVIAYVGAATAYFVLLSRKAETAEYAVWSHWRFERDLFSRLLRVGLPTGGQFLIDIAGFTIFLCIVGRLGPLCQKATNLAFNLNGLSFVPLMGLSPGTGDTNCLERLPVGRRMDGRVWVCLHHFARPVPGTVCSGSESCRVRRDSRHGRRAAALRRLLRVLRRDGGRL